MSDTYGWDMLVDTSVRRGRPLSHTDVITLVVHWTLTRNGYRCQGLDNDNVDFDGNAHGTESLPDGWQNLSENTAIRYTAEGKRYLLMALNSDGEVVYNLLRLLDNNATCVRFRVDETVHSTAGSLANMVPGYKCVVQSIKTALIKLPRNASATSTQAREPGNAREPYHTTPGPNPTPTPGLGVPLGTWSPLAVGRADLDPLGGMRPMPGSGLGGIVGGGNVFDPFTRGPFIHGPPSGMPPGAAPPGARFDPTGPIFPGGRPAGHYPGEPDNDGAHPPM